MTICSNTMNWTKINQALSVCVVADSGRYRAAQDADNAREQYEAADSAFENLLKPRVSELAYTATRKLGVITSLHVRVWPLVNHMDKTAKACITIRWGGKCGRFEIDGIAESDADIARIIDRFSKTLAINRT